MLGGMDGGHFPALSLHGLSASSFSLHPFYSFSSCFQGGGLLLFPVALLFVPPSPMGPGIASWWLCWGLHATIHPTLPAWSALGPTLHPKGVYSPSEEDHSLPQLHRCLLLQTGPPRVIILEKARTALQKTENPLTASDLHTTVLPYGQSSLVEAKHRGAMAKGDLTQPKGLSHCPEEREKVFKGLPHPLCHDSSNCMAEESPCCF